MFTLIDKKYNNVLHTGLSAEELRPKQSLDKDFLLTDEYATLWLITSSLFFIGSIFSKEIFFVYQFIKGASGSGLGILLFLSIIMIIFLLIILSSKLSVHQKQIKKLTQKTGLLDNKLRERDN